MSAGSSKVIALSGGIGGAKLALGLAHELDGDDLAIIANTGDDFEHLGFTICPDIDTLIYTLGGVSNAELGWGRAGETWSFMETVRSEQPELAWFQLGDKDLETHRKRTEAMASGASLSEVTAALAAEFGIAQEILPMSDDPVRTFVEVQTCGAPYWLPFQEYFVREQCKPRVCRICYRGSRSAQPSPRARALLESGGIRGIVICPSNPYLSIDPIIAVPGMTELMRSCNVPIVAVSPIVGGTSLKGPTSKIMEELGKESGVEEIAEHYGQLIDGLVVDTQDRDSIGAIEARGVRAMATNTVMSTLDDRRQLARDVLDFISELAEARGHVGHRTG